MNATKKSHESMQAPAYIERKCLIINKYMLEYFFHIYTV